MRRTISIISIGIALAAFQASVNAAEVVKRQDLPANLKGAKTAKNSDGIPGCATGRVILPASDQTVKDWADAHPKHDCANADQVYVCRVAKNLSVRCE
jgi:hypothetical protein